MQFLIPSMLQFLFCLVQTKMSTRSDPAHDKILSIIPAVLPVRQKNSWKGSAKRRCCKQARLLYERDVD